MEAAGFFETSVRFYQIRGVISQIIAVFEMKLIVNEDNGLCRVW
jgi:hypothetical protein